VPLAGASHELQDDRHGLKAVADHADARVDHTTVSLSRKDATVLFHGGDDVGLADRGR
jgi:hypothetical protein